MHEGCQWVKKGTAKTRSRLWLIVTIWWHTCESHWPALISFTFSSIYDKRTTDRLWRGAGSPGVNIRHCHESLLDHIELFVSSSRQELWREKLEDPGLNPRSCGRIGVQSCSAYSYVSALPSDLRRQNLHWSLADCEFIISFFLSPILDPYSHH